MSDTIHITPSQTMCSQVLRLVMDSLAQKHGLQFRVLAEGKMVDIYDHDGSFIMRAESGNELTMFLAGYIAATRRFTPAEEEYTYNQIIT